MLALFLVVGVHGASLFQIGIAIEGSLAGVGGRGARRGARNVFGVQRCASNQKGPELPSATMVVPVAEWASIISACRRSAISDRSVFWTVIILECSWVGGDMG